MNILQNFSDNQAFVMMTFRFDLSIVEDTLLQGKDINAMAGGSIKSLVAKAPDSKVHGSNMGPIWGRQEPGGPHVLLAPDGPHVGPMNFVIWGSNHP